MWPDHKFRKLILQPFWPLSWSQSPPDSSDWSFYGDGWLAIGLCVPPHNPGRRPATRAIKGVDRTTFLDDLIGPSMVVRVFFPTIHDNIRLRERQKGWWRHIGYLFCVDSFHSPTSMIRKCFGDVGDKRSVVVTVNTSYVTNLFYSNQHKGSGSVPTTWTTPVICRFFFSIRWPRRFGSI